MPDADPRPPVALVSGAASQIGTACLARLGGAGLTPVAGWHRTPPPPGPAIRFDTADASQVDAAVAEVEERIGPIEVLVAAAGFAHLDLALRMSAQRYREVLDVDLTGAFLLARAALAPMARRRRGRIIFIGSAAGLVGVPGVSGYASAKAGLSGLARTLAREVGGRGITVNVVAPGLLDDAVDRIEAHRPTSGADAAWLAATPARRAGAADEVAAVVAHLAGPGGAATTGAVVPVDGGFSLGFG